MSHSAINIASYIFVESQLSAKLSELLLQSASSSAHAVDRAARIIESDEYSETYDRAVSFLAVKSRARQNIRSENSYSGKSIYESTTTIPYDEAANLSEQQAYHDAIDLCSLVDSFAKTEAGIRHIDSQLTLMSKYCQETETAVGNQRQFHWMPRNIDAFKRKVAKVNKDWYLIYHVVMVVHALASTVEWANNTASDGQPIYSLEKLCMAVGVDKQKAEAAIELGSIIPIMPRRKPIKARKSVVTSPLKKNAHAPKRFGKRSSPRSPASKRKTTKANAGKSVKKKKKLKTPSPGTGSPMESRIVREGPDDEFPGWNIQTVRRQTDRAHVDNYWYRPEHKDIVIRSRTGLNAIAKTQRDKGMDFVTACIYLMERDGKAFFKRSPKPKK